MTWLNRRLQMPCDSGRFICRRDRMRDPTSGDGRHVVSGRFSVPHSNLLATVGVLLLTLFAPLPGGNALRAEPDRGRLSGYNESHRRSRNRGDDKTQSDGNLATRVETRDGVFVVYDGGLPPDNQPETRAFLAYWDDFETDEAVRIRPSPDRPGWHLAGAAEPRARPLDPGGNDCPRESFTPRSIE